MKKLFKDAKFGDRFRMRNGEMAVFVKQYPKSKDIKFMFLEYVDDYPIDRCLNFYPNGRLTMERETEFDIIERWEEERL